MKTISLTIEEFELIKHCLHQQKYEFYKAVDTYSEDEEDSEQIERAKAFAADAQLCSQLIQNKFK